MNRLIVCEKPSVAQAIGRALGATVRKDGYIEGDGLLISWCIGHLLGLAPADAYDEKYKKWRQEELPILPERWKHIAAADKGKQLGILTKLMNRQDVESIVNACDAGREGELIFRLVYEYAGCQKPIQRLWISNMEDAAIRDGMANLRPGADYDSLYAAALCREQADWLVGINATRLFSTLYNHTLQVGRVQSPTLALLVERDREIAGFVNEPFYTVELALEGCAAASGRIPDRTEAELMANVCSGSTAVVKSVEATEKTAAPPKLYDLTTLQREANRLFGYTAQQTLDYLQSLYDKKLCTYPRTDSRYLTEDMAAGLPALVSVSAAIVPGVGGDAPAINVERVIDNSKVTDHHAVIPTMSIRDADLGALPAGERHILDLVALRLVCAVGDPHRYTQTVATLDCSGYTFTTKGRTVTHPGWKSVEQAYRATLKQPQDGESEDGEDDRSLPPIVEGSTYQQVRTSIREGFTSPPKAFSEDTLLAAMERAGSEDADPDAERKGLGTPATRAATIEKLVRTGLAGRKKRQLIPTGKGANLIAVLPDAIKSPLLTAEWEHRLKKVERGELEAAAFMEGIAKLVQGLVRDHIAPDIAHAALFTAPAGDAVGGCPRCGKAVHGDKKGFFCADRACGFALWKDNRFFAAKRKKLDKKTAATLLKQGRVSMSGLFSEKTGKTYDAVVVMEPGKPGDKYVNFRLEFTSGKKKEGGTV